MAQNDKAQIIVFGNQKGGVCKTTNSVNIAAGLGAMGKRILLIDADAEASCTRHLGVEPESYLGTYELLAYLNEPEELRLTDDLPKNVDLIPSRPYLSNLKNVLTGHHNIFTRFSIPLEKVRDQYDYIIIDTPPASDAIQTIAAYAAANWLVLSVLPEPFSVDGMLTALRRTVSVVQKETNPDLEVLGVMISGVDNRSNLWREEVVNPLTDMGAGHLIFKHTIRRNAMVPRCQKKGISIFQERGKDQKTMKPVLDDYRGVMQEMLYRMSHVDDFLDSQLLDYELGYPEGWSEGKRSQTSPAPATVAAENEQPTEIASMARVAG